ncbi:MAG: CDC27 family protein [Pirellulales bacterium]
MNANRSRRVLRSGLLVSLFVASFVGCSPSQPADVEHAAKPTPSASTAGGVSVSASSSTERRAESPYLNTRSDAKYVGSEACRACHQEHDASFKHTGMGRSAALVDLDREPPDGAFDHPVSQRRYQVVRREGKLWHRELQLTPAGAAEVLYSEYPMKYVVGSGRHSLTYVYEDDGFLMESPITWYTARKAWDMSPGYDRENHSSFEREVGVNCLGCHVGQAESLDGSMHRVRVDEATISCERCHGPGSLHVKLQTERRTTGEDLTIVNPRRLSRELAEAVCEQCHLRSAAVVDARGATQRDYRPGLSLDDFQHVFRLDPPDDQMTVVGHVEQMHLSRCYQESREFTCLMCHSPHESTPKKGDHEYYNAICQKCHQPAACSSPVEQRQAALSNKQAAAAEAADVNDCITCHMPTSDTDIPHLAFTHHRVGRHDLTSSSTSGKHKPATNDAAQLVPFRGWSSSTTRSDQLRATGLAYLDAATREENMRRRARFQTLSIRLLTQYREQTPGVDGVVDSWLARLRFDGDLGGVRFLAERALGDPTLPGFDRCNALFLLADAQFAARDYRGAIATLDQLDLLRRHSLQQLLRAQCEKELGREPQMVAALERAVHINPHLPQVQSTLASRRTGFQPVTPAPPQPSTPQVTPKPPPLPSP